MYASSFKLVCDFENLSLGWTQSAQVGSLLTDGLSRSFKISLELVELLVRDNVVSKGIGHAN